ncbi:integrase core domain-containing protein [Nonomuraea angiospora]|uniref:integrase core domain-containing protein n=1 Tax=Nonomuraea angiospora TaxID=46172 RepID=UPI003328FB35
MLLLLAYLTMRTAVSFLRLLPRTDRDKEIEILVLRHQLTVLRRQVAKPAFTPADRFLLAGLLHRLPMDKLRRLVLLVRPDTILRRHRDLLRRRHAAASALRRRGRPRTVRSIRLLVLRLARENTSWGYRRIHGEPAALGIEVAASTVWEILKTHGIDPSPERTATTWAAFLRSQAGALPACDFFEVRTLTGARLYTLAVIEHATRRIRVLGVTAHPTRQWVTPLGRNLAMDLQDVGTVAKFLIRDRDAKFTAAFDAVLADAGVRIVKSGVRIPRMNPIMERWIQTCRLELLDRTLIWNERHLLHALREFETFYNEHRPHRAVWFSGLSRRRSANRSRACAVNGAERMPWEAADFNYDQQRGRRSTETEKPQVERGIEE